MNKIDNVIGAIVGDVVGSIYEFDNHRNKDFPLFGKRCFATDDSIMTLAVADAIMHSYENNTKLFDEAVKSMQKIGRPYPYCGFGGSFQRWIYSANPQPYNSFGNGAAMRISPVANVASYLFTVEQLSDEVTSVTHNHPEGMKGAKAVAVANWMALNGYSKKDILEEIVSKYYGLDFTIDGIRDTYRFNETCQDTVPQAIVAFREGNDFEDVIRTAISVGGDSDTLAAIAGSIAGAYYGVPEHIDREVRTYLDDRLLDILERFEVYVNSKSK